MNETQVNIPLLRKAVEWVEEQAALPEIDREWDQTSYVLSPENRAQVLALRVNRSTPTGSVVEVAKRIEHMCGTAYCVAGKVASDLDPRYADSEVVDGVHVAEFAANALGIDGIERSQLFHARNTAAMVREIAESLAGERL